MEEEKYKTYPPLEPLLEKPKWRCELFGLGNHFILNTTKRPNWFWRMMQYLLVGNKWGPYEE